MRQLCYLSLGISYTKKNIMSNMVKFFHYDFKTYLGRYRLSDLEILPKESN